MAENNPDDLESLINAPAPDQPETDAALVKAGGEKLARGPSDENENNTRESATVKAEEVDHSSKGVSSDGVQARSQAKKSALQALLDSDSDQWKKNQSHSSVKKANNGRLIPELDASFSDLNNLLAVKEDLRLLALKHMIPGPYYEVWTKEANLFFRRLVIINRRLENSKKQKRA